MRAIIIAAGDGKRWGNYLGVPKHFAPVEGEAILHRLVRQLRERGVRDLHIVAPRGDPRYSAAGGRLYHPAFNYREHADADKFLNSRELWNPGGRTLVVYGDCYLTDEAADTIVNYRVREWQLFARFGPHPYTAKKNSECFAQSFYPEHQAEHHEMLRYVAKLRTTGVIRRCGGWEHYHAMTGKRGRDVYLRDPKGARQLGRATHISDWSDDFDKPAQYRQFVAARQAASEPVSVLIPYMGSDPDREGPLQYVTRRWRDEYPDWRLIMGSCTAPWRKGLAIMDAARQVQGGYLIIADADVWTPGIGAAVRAMRAGSPWVKPHSRFVRLTQAATERVLASQEDLLEDIARRPENHEMKPYRQVACGGVVAMRHDVLLGCPPDPRFTGWGGEDTSWSDALRVLVGQPRDAGLTTYHLWHTPAVQGARTITPRRNSPLRQRYKAAKRHPKVMRELVAEARAAYGEPK